MRQFLTPDQCTAYRLIWNRFVSSQMLPALFDDTTVDITAGDYLLRVKGSVPKFAGWMAVYEAAQVEGTDIVAPETDDDEATGVLPVLCGRRPAELKVLRPEQKFTQPPPRFSEATLVKELEGKRGRPPEHTYASILGTLQDRDYVVKIEGRFKPTYLGFIITDILIRNFNDILDGKLWRRWEEQLDDIEHGRADYEGTLKSFYKKFKKDLGKFEDPTTTRSKGRPPTRSARSAARRWSSRSDGSAPFMACCTYPDCTNNPNGALDAGSLRQRG